MSAANAARRSYRYFLATMRWVFNNNNKHNNNVVVLCWGWCGDWWLLWWSWWWWWWFSTFCALRFMLSELNKAQTKRQQNFPQVCFDSDSDWGLGVIEMQFILSKQLLPLWSKVWQKQQTTRKVFFKGLQNLQNKLSKAITTETTTITNRREGSRTADEHGTYRFHAHVVEEYSSSSHFHSHTPPEIQAQQNTENRYRCIAIKYIYTHSLSLYFLPIVEQKAGSVLWKKHPR